MKCLNDKDRLVRESGCLALGHLKCEKAVPQLVQLWSVHQPRSIFMKQCITLKTSTKGSLYSESHTWAKIWKDLTRGGAASGSFGSES